MNIIRSNETFYTINLIFFYVVGPLSLTFNALLLYMIFTRTPVKFNELSLLQANIAIMAIIGAISMMLSQHRSLSVSDFIAEALGPVKYIGTPSISSHIAYFLFWLNMCLPSLTLINIAVILGMFAIHVHTRKTH
ncbi:unnamed protein product [Gongylonema pulchrum]|uniref:G_PROTEIN_RECEP_F1_2 domain-containing protein n=1 Tax=Gongylonema pulchrum TaxID=637853 RepID=A0A183EPX4_9BILA|nr:unnamed protein product [Gongylonema pulchrum]